MKKKLTVEYLHRSSKGLDTVKLEILDYYGVRRLTTIGLSHTLLTVKNMSL